MYVGDAEVYDDSKGESVIWGKSYKTVRIGSQVWMAENLDSYPSGITFLPSRPAASSSTESQCFYYDSEYDHRKGLLFTFKALKVVIAGASDGWRVPSRSDCEKLSENSGADRYEQWRNLAGRGYANPVVRDAAKDGAWGVDTYDGSGFGAVPSGSGNLGPSQPAPFKLKGTHGIYWTTTKYSSSRAYNPIIRIGEAGTLAYFPDNTADVELDYNLFSVMACRSAV